MAGPDVDVSRLAIERGDSRALPAVPRPCSCPGEEDFGIVPVEAQACGRPVVALGRGGAAETVVDGETGVLVADASADAFADGAQRACGRSASNRGASATHAQQFSRDRFRSSGRVRDGHRRRRDADAAGRRSREVAMIRRYNRLLVAFYVVTRRAARHGGVRPRLPRSASRRRPHPRHEGLCRRSTSTCNVLPFIGVLVPLAFQVQGLYRLRRGRSRVDDFFARLRRQHPRRRPRPRRHAVLPGLLRRRTR